MLMTVSPETAMGVEAVTAAMLAFGSRSLWSVCATSGSLCLCWNGSRLRARAARKQKHGFCFMEDSEQNLPIMKNRVTMIIGERGHTLGPSVAFS